MTGVRYVSAIRAASSAASKQSAGERGAMTGTGASPLRPNIACSRSDCSVLVGSPVEGPPRCTSTTTSGSSVITASPMVSDLSATPGPEVVVTPSEPALEERDGRLGGPPVHPREQPQREHVLGAGGVLARQPELLDGLHGHAGEVDRVHRVLVEGVGLEWVL